MRLVNSTGQYENLHPTEMSTELLQSELVRPDWFNQLRTIEYWTVDCLRELVTSFLLVRIMVEKFLYFILASSDSHWSTSS